MVNRKYSFLAIDDQIDNLVTIKALIQEIFIDSEVITHQSMSQMLFCLIF